MSNRFHCLVVLIGLVFGFTAVALAATPLEIVNQRMKLYNDHRSEPMLNLYADNVAVFTYPDQLVGRGKDHMRRVLAEIFSDKEVRVTIISQIVNGSYVINEELVNYVLGPQRYVSIYEVRDDLIQSVRFVRQ